MAKHTKEKIFQAMLELIQEVGLEKASIGTLAQKAQISSGNIYYHFASKHTLISELYLYCKTLLWQHLYFDQTASLSSLKSVTFNAMDFYTANPDIFLFIHFSSLSSYLTNENITAANELFTPLTSLVKKLGENGIINNDSIMMNDYILSLINQYVHAVIQNKYKPSKENQEKLWNIFLHGASK